MPEPLSTLFAAGLGVALQALWDDSHERKRIIDEITSGMARDMRQAIAEWLDAPTNKALLLSDDSKHHGYATLELQDILVERGIEPPTPLDAIVATAKAALFNRLPAPAVIRATEDRIRADIARHHDHTVQLIDAVTDATRQPVETLPPAIKQLLHELRDDDQSLANWLTRWLASPPTRQSLENQLGSDSPLRGAGHLAWEAVARHTAARGCAELAARYWQRVEQTSPNASSAAANRALILAAVDPAEALSIAESAANDPESGTLAQAVHLTLQEDYRGVVELPQTLDLSKPDDQLATLLVAQALAAQGDFDAAIQIADGVARQPNQVVGKVQLASLLLAKVLQGRSTARSADLNSAREFALEARRLQHSWRLPARRATAIAMQVAFENSDAQEILDLAEESEREGYSDELDSGEVAMLIAIAGSIRGKTDQTLHRLTDVQRRFIQTLAQDSVGESSPIDDSSYRDALTETLELAEDDNDVVRILQALARVGAAPEERILEIQARHPQSAEFIRALQLQAQGHSAEATALLRRHAANTADGAWCLSYLLAAVDEYEQVAEVAVQSWHRYRDVNLLTFGLEAAARIPRSSASDGIPPVVSQVYGLATAVLAEPGLTETQQRRILDGLAGIDIYAGRWPAASEWLDRLVRLGSHPSTAWRLAQAHINCGWPRRAWDVVAAGDRLLAPLDAQSAQLLASLTSAFSDDSDHVHQLLSACELLSGDVEAVGILTTGAYRLATLFDDRAASEAVHAALEQYVERNPENGFVRRFSVADLSDPGELEQIVPSPEPELVEIERWIRIGCAPFAAATMLSPISYCAVLATKYDGVFHAVSNSLINRQRDRADARDAVDSRVVIDATALYALARLDYELEKFRVPMSDEIIASLRLVEIPVPTAVDAFNALAGRSVAPDGILIPPIAGRDGHQYVEYTDAIRKKHEELTRLIVRLTDRIGRIDAVVDGFYTRDRRERPTWGAAFASADLGVAEGLHVWVDDDTLRAWLRNRGVRVFSTPALLDVLHEYGRLSNEQYADCRRALFSGRITILPVLPSEIMRLAAIQDHRDDTATTPLTQPGWWMAQYNKSHGRADALFDYVASGRPDAMPNWFFAAAIGTGRMANNVVVPAQIMVYLLHHYDSVRPYVEDMLSALRGAVRLLDGQDLTPEVLAAALRFICGDQTDLFRRTAEKIFAATDDSIVEAALTVLDA